VEDPVDKCLLQHLSNGVFSYEDLARKCGVSRNTVYRRVAVLEKKRVISRMVRSVLDYDQLNVVALCIGISVPEARQEEVVAFLRLNPKVKLLWRTYGRHNIISIVFCLKGREGETVHDLKSALEELGILDVDVSVGYRWDKTDFSPFAEEPEMGKIVDTEVVESEERTTTTY
jgi:DNA-binding Lrp family transcriptional regulator